MTQTLTFARRIRHKLRHLRPKRGRMRASARLRAWRYAKLVETRASDA